MTAKLEIVGLALGLLGFVGTCIVTGLPNWRVTAFIGANLIDFQTLWEGLWMDCYKEIYLRIQCKMYDSVLILPPELQAARALMCISIVLSFIAMLLSILGIRTSNCCQDSPRGKDIALVASGSIYILSCITTMVPIAWVTHNIINTFYNPLVIDAQKMELGEALFVGWATAGLLLAAGVILILSCTKRHDKDDYSLPDTLLQEQAEGQFSRTYSKSEYV